MVGWWGHALGVASCPCLRGADLSMGVGRVLGAILAGQVLLDSCSAGSWHRCVLAFDGDLWASGGWRRGAVRGGHGRGGLAMVASRDVACWSWGGSPGPQPSCMAGFLGDLCAG